MHRRVLPVLAALAILTAAPACSRHYTQLAPSLRALSSPPAAPDLTGRDEVTFLILGDPGRGNDHQYRVGRLMRDACAKRTSAGRCDFALITGDLIYNNGVSGVDDPRFASKFERPFEPLGDLPFWVVPGNHDWHRAGSVQAQIDYTAKSPRWRMPANHYAVPSLPGWLHIYGLDTTVIEDTRHSAHREGRLAETRKQLEAAKQDLCGKPGWRVLLGHHPVYSSGQHARSRGPRGQSPEMAEHLLGGVIQPCAVQVYFAGHDHHQEHVRAAGFDQFVQGSAAEVRRDIVRVALPDVQTVFAEPLYGFALATATPRSMRIELYGYRDREPDEQVLANPAHSVNLTVQ
jgi:tartrate-resistant acid phosphatase type 5